VVPSVQLGPLGIAATNIGLLCPPPGDYDGEIGGMKIGRGNRSTRRKPAPMPLCPRQTPHVARMRTRAAAVGHQRLTAKSKDYISAMYQLHVLCILWRCPLFRPSLHKILNWICPMNSKATTFQIFYRLYDTNTLLAFLPWWFWRCLYANQGLK
jgi:hypothetical protein